MVFGQRIAYLHPVATGSDQFSWNHCTCVDPGLVLVSLTRRSRGVSIVDGGTGSCDIFLLFMLPSLGARAVMNMVAGCCCFLYLVLALSLYTIRYEANCLCDSGTCGLGVENTGSGSTEFRSDLADS